jgi:ATP-dependent RNA helicase RhlE
VDERPYLRDIEKLIKQAIPVIPEHPFMDLDDDEEVAPAKPTRPARRPQRKPFDSKRKSDFKPKTGGKPKSFKLKRD